MFVECFFIRAYRSKKVPSVDLKFIQNNLNDIFAAASNALSFGNSYEIHEQVQQAVQSGKKRLPLKYMSADGAVLADEKFPHYNANHIVETSYGKTPFVAVGGPHGHEEVGRLFQSTLFNEVYPCRVIVMLCKELSTLQAQIPEVDSVAYFLPGVYQEYIVKLNTKLKPERFVHSPLAPDAFFTLQDLNQYKLAVTNPEKTKESVLDLYCFSMRDGGCLALEDSGLKKLLLQIYDKLAEAVEKNEGIVVHCSAGLGRTGHFLMVMLLLQHFDKIFSGEDVNEIGDRISKLLIEIREYRPGLVLRETQLKGAIEMAVSLYQYRLQLNNDEVDVQTIKPSRAFPKPLAATWPPKGYRSKETTPLIPPAIQPVEDVATCCVPPSCLLL